MFHVQLSYMHTELLSKLEKARPGLRSGTDDCLYNVPFNKGLSFIDRSFGTVGPTLCNGLPFYVRRSESFEIFKSRLKTFTFSKDLSYWFTLKLNFTTSIMWSGFLFIIFNVCDSGFKFLALNIYIFKHFHDDTFFVKWNLSIISIPLPLISISMAFN